MKPSELAKAHGMKNLNELSELSCVPVQTLLGWHRNKPQLFNVVLRGAAITKLLKTTQTLKVDTYA